jgi:hypothetical protein
VELGAETTMAEAAGRSRESMVRANRGTAVGAEDAPCCGESDPCGDESWETSESAGDKHLRRAVAVNTGRRL